MMKSKLVIGLFLSALLAMAACSRSDEHLPGKVDSINAVSVINLIATPEKYTGKLIRVQEVIIPLGGGGWAMYLSSEDAASRNTKNGIAVFLSSAQRQPARHMHQVVITGKFLANVQADLMSTSAFSGELHESSVGAIGPSEEEPKDQSKRVEDQPAK